MSSFKIELAQGVYACIDRWLLSFESPVSRRTSRKTFLLSRSNETCRVNHASMKLASEMLAILRLPLRVRHCVRHWREENVPLFRSRSAQSVAWHARVNYVHRLPTRSPSRKCSIVSFVVESRDPATAWIWFRNSPPHVVIRELIVSKSRVFDSCRVFFFLFFVFYFFHSSDSREVRRTRG